LLIAHSENPNILRQYSVLMRDLYGDDRLGIEMLYYSYVNLAFNDAIQSIIPEFKAELLQSPLSVIPFYF
ncbi:MAG: hypothetical protein EZS28_024175, partial [Streblomastix strix]